MVLLGSAVGELVCEVTAVGELVCEVTAVGEYAGRPLKAGSSAQGLLCPLCACCVRAVWEIPYTECVVWCTGWGKSATPYTEWAVWCTEIKIMMRTAKKRALILAVGGGFDAAAKKRGDILAV